MFDDFYGLQGRPFQLTPDAAFYFESLTHRKALSYLNYGLAQGEGFVVITGEVGAGKSTLVAHLMNKIDPARLTAAQIVTSKLDGDEIVHVVAQAFGLAIEGHDKATALGAIEAFLHDEARAGRRCLLVVDEAQNLEIEALEELRMLSNFQLGAHPLLQTLLLGQPEFRDTLQTSPRLEQLRQRVIASHHLDAMEASEIQPYIEHRMKCVGWTGNPAFTPDVFTGLHAATGGVPRRVNQIVNRLLLLGAVEERRVIDGATLDQVLAELARDGALTMASPAPAPAPAAEPKVEAVSEPVAEEAADPADEPSFAFAAPEPEPVAEAAPEPEVAEAEPEAAPEPAPAPLPVFTAPDSRDAQIAELQQAVLELSNADAAGTASADRAAIAALQERLAALESRLIEQDHTIRHTLTMLIEWIESDSAQRAAA